MGYSPQMTAMDIKKTYVRLAGAFARQPFDEVFEECRQIIKKYYACFPLLLRMVILLMNHHMLANKEQHQAIIQEAIDLCIRVKIESNDVRLSKEAISLQATCYLILQQAQEVLDLLGTTVPPIITEADLIAQAYQMLGDISKLKKLRKLQCTNIY